MGLSEATSLAIESWTLFAIAILTVAARLVSRTILLGSARKWQIDDYIMMVVVLLYTVVIVGVNQTSVNLNNYLPDSFFATITPAQTASAIYGSKWAFATEICKVTMVWLCKACMLILYNHMTITEISSDGQVRRSIHIAWIPRRHNLLSCRMVSPSNSVLGSACFSIAIPMRILL